MKTKWMFIVVGVATLMSACGSGASFGPEETYVIVDPPVYSVAVELIPLRTSDDVQKAIRDRLTLDVARDLEGLKTQCSRPMVASTDSPLVAAPMVESGGAVSATQTNIQEAGVDEADLLKIEAGIAYALNGSDLNITQIGAGDQLKALSQVAIDGDATDLFVFDKKVIVFSRLSNPQQKGKAVASKQSVAMDSYYGYTKLTVLDVQNPEKPTVVRETVYSGQLVTERRVGNKIRFIMNSALNVPSFTEKPKITPPACDKEGKAAGDASAWMSEIARLQQASIKKFAETELVNALPEMPLNAIVEYFDSPSTSGARFVEIVTLDANDLSGRDHISVTIGVANTVYATARALYIAGFTWNGAANVIHHFNMDEAATAYAGSGRVIGQMLNQFSMSEYQGALRVGVQSPGQTSAVYVLDATRRDMPVMGKVDNLAKGETLRAVRFVGDRGYVVTFKEVDPLFVLDLKDPANPKVAGELKIPGFSTYLHPYGDHQLIGLGLNVLGDGWTVNGLKLSLFDVSDATHPVEVHTTVIGTGFLHPDVLDNHHAFSMDTAQNILSFPSNTNTLSGFSVSSKGFSAIGTFQSAYDPSTYYGAAIMRSATITQGNDVRILSLSSDGFRLHQLDATLTESAVVTW